MQLPWSTVCIREFYRIKRQTVCQLGYHNEYLWGLGGVADPMNSNKSGELGMPRNSIRGMQYKAHDGAICRLSSLAITCWKIQLAGYRARRFPQQYLSIARTSNNAMCPPIGFNSLLFTCYDDTAHPLQTAPSVICPSEHTLSRLPSSSAKTLPPLIDRC